MNEFSSLHAVIEEQFIAIQNSLGALEMNVDGEIILLEESLDIQIEHLQSRLESIQFQLSAIEEREIETHLAGNNQIASFYLPELQGGKLTSVQTVVKKWIDSSEQAGLDVSRALLFYDQAVEKVQEHTYCLAFT